MSGGWGFIPSANSAALTPGAPWQGRQLSSKCSHPLLAAAASEGIWTLSPAAPRATACTLAEMATRSRTSGGVLAAMVARPVLTKASAPPPIRIRHTRIPSRNFMAFLRSSSDYGRAGGARGSLQDRDRDVDLHHLPAHGIGGRRVLHGLAVAEEGDEAGAEAPEQRRGAQRRVRHPPRHLAVLVPVLPGGRDLLLRRRVDRALLDVELQAIPSVLGLPRLAVDARAHVLVLEVLDRAFLGHQDGDGDLDAHAQDGGLALARVAGQRVGKAGDPLFALVRRGDDRYPQGGEARVRLRGGGRFRLLLLLGPGGGDEQQEGQAGPRRDLDLHLWLLSGETAGSDNGSTVTAGISSSGGGSTEPSTAVPAIRRGGAGLWSPRVATNRRSASSWPDGTSTSGSVAAVAAGRGARAARRAGTARGGAAAGAGGVLGRSLGLGRAASWRGAIPAEVAASGRRAGAPRSGRRPSPPATTAAPTAAAMAAIQASRHRCRSSVSRTRVATRAAKSGDGIALRRALRTRSTSASARRS